MAYITQGSKVTISYIGTLEDGTIFYSTEEHGPLTLTIGAEQVFPALERALIGMRAGECKNLVLAAGDAYGPRRAENILKVPRSVFPAQKELAVGQRLSIDFKMGESRVMQVIRLDEGAVTLDGNHALAGCELSFALRVDRVG
ncbi:peptidyl-prolyl cis-trans isomerase [Geomonas silvestris]|uniref:Peptidyl-prolyl cis-trans isomerase n=1 Tax=Geomonas silvestris TaxID=2740184 RepID=A0A6V8MHN9_9BACT|nr:FKBP-type peptidyl-prolyl cis-trans isomerase [Geomonas silvestris]GFO59508.1 peptidyl-prolyl cis-trans isomerase [Geomonas silvestris]